MGAAGDMIMAALLELHSNPEDFLRRFRDIGIPNLDITAKKSFKCGISGTHVKVAINGYQEESLDHNHDNDHGHGRSHDHHHHNHDHENEHHSHDHEHSHDHHSNEHDQHNNENYSHDHDGTFRGIGHLINHLDVSDTVKKYAMGVYKLIADAESQVHGTTIERIHFHEVGEMDAVADIVGVCMLIEELAPDVILASPINVGSGHVRCSHGILPVPAPATALILRGVTIYSDTTKGELCTPTGAALLKYFVGKFCSLPIMIVQSLGYGMGSKDFEKANCVRAYIGQSDAMIEDVTELVCNLDDMTPESIAFAAQLLFDEGALDVYTYPIGMKKGRTGISLTCMCRASDRDKMLALIFKHTTTLGAREYVSRRFALQKEESVLQTRLGPVRIKTSHGFGTKKSKPEYKDVSKIAAENNLSISDVLGVIAGASAR